MVSDAHLTGAKDSVTTSSVALVLTTAIAAEQRDWGLADDAEDGLEALPRQCGGVTSRPWHGLGSSPSSSSVILRLTT